MTNNGNVIEGFRFLEIEIIMPNRTDKLTSSPTRKSGKPFLGSFFWIVDILLVLVVIALIFLNPLEFMALNYLFHLGQQKKWEEASQKLPEVRKSYQSNPRYSRIKLETLLHLAKNSEALALIETEKDLMRKSNKETIRFQQTAAFGFELMGKEKEAEQIFTRHAGNALSSEMARLIGSVRGNRDIDHEKMPVILNLVRKQMTYPDLPSAVVKYLFARAHLQRENLSEAIALLEEINKIFPYEYAIQRALGLAYLDARRYDLAGIHLRIARRQLRDRILYPYSAEEELNFERSVRQHTYGHSASLLNSEFWRLLRGLSAIFPSMKNWEPFPINKHPFSAAEAWEWAHYVQARDAYQWRNITTQTLSLREKTIFAALMKEVNNSSDAMMPAQVIHTGMNTSTTLLHSRWINRTEVGLVNTGQSASFSVPPATGYAESGLVLCLIRGSLREEIPGGCEVSLGQDKYYVALDGKPQWHAFPLPVLTAEPIPLTFIFNSDSVAGYTTKPDSGDRNLYVTGILVCHLEKR